ncbi:NGG1p interacting factor NIF3 [Simiduia aestuariiviva]|uniref:NGG1p interacting factor NIF3 n=1 Tax=Simiduia aestuariiviva TaxID=1510459 RepID=A0A839UNW4_9GAMM|nr:NGG1p interacting factor NIF3 [Simiduia aestuariiviva]MBB3168229.1 hypothetical protein [Simiduia aestuariiviva]
MFKLCVYVPNSHVEAVKTAVFAAGAGEQGDYEACCWQVEGHGQFRPRAGAQPYIGAIDTLERVPECRVEMLVSERCAGAVIAALRGAHPYEEPAFDLIKLVDVETLL